MTEQEKRYRAFLKEARYWRKQGLKHREYRSYDNNTDYRYLIVDVKTSDISVGYHEPYEGIQDNNVSICDLFGEPNKARDLVAKLGEDLPWFEYVKEYRIIWGEDKVLIISKHKVALYIGPWCPPSTYEIGLLDAAKDARLLKTIAEIREWLKTNKPQIHQEQNGAKWLGTNT